MAVVVETARMVLREMEEGDLGFLEGLLGDPEVMRFFAAPLSREEARGWLERQWERYGRDGYGYWIARLREGSEGGAGGVAVGQAGVLGVEVEGERLISLGYVFAVDHWGRGLATEAAVACMDWAFDVLGVERVSTLVRPENAASVAVARRVGMEVERRARFAGFEHLVLGIARVRRDELRRRA